jgi:ABC-type Fe3+ transport system substrate-binding protein
MHMIVRVFVGALVGLSLVLSGTKSFAAEASAEQLYSTLAKLPAEQREKRLEEGARSEGKLNFVHTWRGKNARDHVKLFEKRYPFVKVDMGDLGSQDAAERFIAEEIAGRHLTDILTLGVPDMAVILKQNLVAKYPTPATKRILKQYQGFIDKEKRWVPWYWAEHGISYNTNLIKPDKAPMTWFDLCKPEFKGQASFDPSETRFLAGLYVMLGEEKTKEWLKCMGQNQPIVQTGHTQRMELMLTGDHALQGDNYFYTGMEAKKKDPKAPFAMVLSAPILSFAGGMIINKNAKNPYASALFVDWTLSQDSQNLINEILRGPLAIKHPFLPDNVKLVTYNIVSDDITKRLHDAWGQYIGRGK